MDEIDRKQPSTILLAEFGSWAADHGVDVGLPVVEAAFDLRVERDGDLPCDVGRR
jgi:hypothetical protein